MFHMQMLCHKSISYFSGFEGWNGPGCPISPLRTVFYFWLIFRKILLLHILFTHLCQVVLIFILEVMWFLQFLIAAVFTEQQSNVRKVQREQPQNEGDTPLKG